MKKTEVEQTRWCPCASCGNGIRRHSILHETKISYGDFCGLDHEVHHLFLQCMGCDSIRYQRYKTSPYRQDEFGNEEEFETAIWPENEHTGQRQHVEFRDAKITGTIVPGNVMKMYLETIWAFNSDAKTLAGGGLRATVEAICIAQGLLKGTLEQKINELAKRGLLTTAQADLLHEERYIGNSALHELATPSKDDIEDGLQIVEGLITTLYVLPIKAERLKNRRSVSPNSYTPKNPGKTKK
jgi:hypothetical protein